MIVDEHGGNTYEAVKDVAVKADGSAVLRYATHKQTIDPPTGFRVKEE